MIKILKLKIFLLSFKFRWTCFKIVKLKILQPHRSNFKNQNFEPTKKSNFFTFLMDNSNILKILLVQWNQVAHCEIKELCFAGWRNTHDRSGRSNVINDLAVKLQKIGCQILNPGRLTCCGLSHRHMTWCIDLSLLEDLLQPLRWNVLEVNFSCHRNRQKW